MRHQKTILATLSSAKMNITVTKTLCDTSHSKDCSPALQPLLAEVLGVLTAPKFQGAGVHVHGEVLQVHGALGVDGQPVDKAQGLLRTGWPFCHSLLQPAALPKAPAAHQPRGRRPPDVQRTEGHTSGSFSMV